MIKAIPLTLSLLAGVVIAGTARASSPASESATDALVRVRADLDAIADELRNYPDAQASLRIRKIVDRARARVDKGLGAASSAPANEPAAAATSPSTAGPAPAAGAPAATAKGQMAPDAFRGIIQALKAQELDSARMGVVRSAMTGGKNFTAAQIAQILHWFTGSDMRVEVAAVMHPSCSDPGGYGVVYEKLDSEAARQRLRSRLEGKETDDRPDRTVKRRK